VSVLPGGGQFLLGETAEGFAWAGATAGALAWGLSVHKSDPGELNAPLLLCQQIYVAGFYSYYRDVRLKYHDSSWPPPDPTPTYKLAAAPFAWDSLKSPWVYGAAAVGFGVNYAQARFAPGRQTYADLRGMRYLGGSFNQEGALAAYSAYWIPISLGAGVAEEGLFRGVLQNDFEHRWGPNTGLVAASGVFGLGHGIPFDSGAPGRVAFAALAGLYLGRLYQLEGYRLSKGIAAHFWWDAAGGLAAFLANPAQNPLGAKVTYAW
jgi:membrane protease YdiL (CAAX protease family)